MLILWKEIHNHVETEVVLTGGGVESKKEFSVAPSFSYIYRIITLYLVWTFSINQADKTIVVGFPVAEIINRYKIAIAAAVSLVVVVWFALNPFGTLSGPELFAEHFEPYPNVIGMTRGINQQQVDERTAAYMAYDRGDYAQAVDVFGKILPGSDDQTLDLFYLGNAYLAIGNNEKIRT